ncbi:hypothetical protein COCVIDRAFT_28261 [Bipolaris victoriae FI3]|uniref:Uncharacterized protein n=2 Tax=Bipolaris TaxID=33194 RepID=W6XTY0_COCC2|nr:uncharacterized protein COCCADRAFT_6946 [Bipolaris zeicola 26-R-13]XP_014554688.1 hypothetical protein COCVIDRAFT_28261 [Bipolaris victoriae FI3]EUC31107.1 hypothetical protein COCCADRAFT_6946 [Bipolaris zeicola 26-R-13]
MKTTTFLTTIVLLTPTVFARCLFIGAGNGQTCSSSGLVYACDNGSTPGPLPPSVTRCVLIPNSTAYCCSTA